MATISEIAQMKRRVREFSDRASGLYGKQRDVLKTLAGRHRNERRDLSTLA